MKSLCLLLACLLVFSGSACAEKYVYWNGTIDQGNVESLFGEEAETGLHAWDYETDTHIFLGVNAHPIESDEDGILAVNYGAEMFPKEITVYRCRDAAVLESWKITLPDAVDTVFAIRDGWIYYSYVVIGDVPEEAQESMRFRSDWLECAEEFGIRRWHMEDQIMQDYVIPGMDSAKDMPRISVGENGRIAFEGIDGEFDWFAPAEEAVLQLYTAMPEEQPVLIEEVGDLSGRYNDYLPVWLEDGRLMYIHPNADEFWAYDGDSHVRVGAEDADVPYDDYCADQSGQYIASHIVAPERVWGEVAFYRLQLVSPADGREVTQSETWVWNDEGIQFGN